MLLASERSQRDTTQSKIGDVCLLGSVASETLTRVTHENPGCLFIYLFIYLYIYGRMYVILYFDPRVFVLFMWSTPS